MFGNLGFGEILIILMLILVLFGPEKIPELARTVGRYIYQFRRQMEEAQRAVIDPIRSDLNLHGGPPAQVPPYTYTPPPPPLTGPAYNEFIKAPRIRVIDQNG